jgi:hypothetical protein
MSGRVEYTDKITNMLHGRASTLIAVPLIAETPMQGLAIARFAVIIGEWVGTDESNQAVHLANLSSGQLCARSECSRQPTRFCRGVPDKHHLYSLCSSNVAFAVLVDRSLML